MVKTRYVDTDALNKKIDESGLKVGYIIEQLGISYQSFDKKRKGITPFRGAEIFALCVMLKIEGDERPRIFCV